MAQRDVFNGVPTYVLPSTTGALGEVLTVGPPATPNTLVWAAGGSTTGIETINTIAADGAGNFVLDPGTGVSIIQTAINQLTITSTAPSTVLVTGVAGDFSAGIINNPSTDVTAYTSAALTIPSTPGTVLQISYSFGGGIGAASVQPVTIQLFATPPLGAPVIIGAYDCFLSDTIILSVTGYFYIPASLVANGSVLSVHLLHPNQTIVDIGYLSQMFMVTAFTP